MWKTLAALLGIGLLLNAPAPASARPDQTIRPGGCVVRTIEIEGTLGYHGNAFGRLPNGLVITTTIGFPWEGYFVDAGPKRYILDLPIGDEKAERLKGKKVRVSGRLEHRQVGWPGKFFQMPFLRHVRVKAAGSTLQERTYLGSSADYWQTADGLHALKSGDRRSRIEHVRALLGEDLKSGKHTVRVAGNRLVVRTTAANHARIKQFLDMLKVIPGPAH
jgi:hypothetical protein